MNGCPICQGTLVVESSSSGPEIYCDGCRNIIVSSTLGFKFAWADDEGMSAYDDASADTEEDQDAVSDDTGGAAIEQCFLNGLPGWKSTGEKARCYTYPPGSKKDEARAKQKAVESAYTQSREGHVKKLAFDFGATDLPDALTGKNGTPKPVPPTETLTAVQTPSYLNDFGVANASRKTSIAMPNLEYSHSEDLDHNCSDCGVTH